MIPSIVTDELSADPETAFELGLKWGVTHYELRGIYESRVPSLSAYARHRLSRAVRDFGVTITALSPGVFKGAFPGAGPEHSNLFWMGAGHFRKWQEGKKEIEHHLHTLLPRAIELAAELGTRFVIGFSFHRAGLPGGAAPASVIETLTEAAETTRKAGLEFLIETEEGHWADTGARSAALVERIGDPSLGINWDPANALIDGDIPYPDGYAAAKRFVRNVHFKDARRYPDRTWEILPEGDVDWQGQIKALLDDGYGGAIAVEPHLFPSVARTRAALDRLRALVAAAGGGMKNGHATGA
ncbi:MAG: sugar phosphate isomerase/epimerase family protein [Rhizobiaceae bacterium]